MGQKNEDEDEGRDPALKAAVLGWPVSHSLSPKLHNYWIKHHNIDGIYTTMAVMPEHLPAAVDILRERGFKGCNLTIPLKEAALPLITDHDESCLMSGAVNTVVFQGDVIRGFNSDGFGFMEGLKMQKPDWDGTRVVVVGTGGASRGIIASLKAEGAKHFVLINRTVEKAERVVKQFKLNAEIVEWKHRADALKDATMLINCSSLGMDNHPKLDLPLTDLPETATVCDIVYRPQKTPLLKDARMRGNPVVQGLPMLLHQGRLGFEYWFGTDPEITKGLYKMMIDAIN